MESFETQESAAGQKEFDKVSVASLVLVLLAFCSALLPMTDSGPPSLFVAFLIFYFPGGVCGIWGLIRTKKSPHLRGRSLATTTLLIGNPISLWIIGIFLYFSLGTLNGGCC